jgi:hypothetical protein
MHPQVDQVEELISHEHQEPYMELFKQWVVAATAPLN